MRATPPAPTVIAVISFSAAVLGTAEAQHDLDALRNKYAPRQQQLQKLNDSVEALRNMLANPLES
jgi:Skp family chaperone for outer membrane proteins